MQLTNIFFIQFLLTHKLWEKFHFQTNIIVSELLRNSYGNMFWNKNMRRMRLSGMGFINEQDSYFGKNFCILQGVKMNTLEKKLSIYQ